MPAEYEAIRDSLIKSGKPIAEAKRIGAATYNKNHPGQPMSNTHHASIDALKAEQ